MGLWKSPLCHATSAILLIIFFCSVCFAGVFELSATANYRKTYYDASHSEALESGTGALAYYFWELSALEFSFTRGDGSQVEPEYTVYQDFTSYGIDLLVTMANRDSELKPYLKVGAAYVIKNLRYIIPTFPPTTVETDGVAPTAGFGFKFMLGQQFGIKAGVDVQTSPLSTDPVTYDFAANGGISFLF